MLQYIFSNLDSDFITLLGILFAFCMTCFALAKWSKYLPKDLGRDFAHDGKLSAGKPRGAGFVFIIVFCVCSVLFGQYHNEFLIYAILVAAAMMTGFLDDCARMPWGGLKKGLLDLMIAVMVAITFLNFNSNVVEVISLGQSIEIPTIVFALLTIVLVWGSINVTNCTDGVDGLSATLTIVTLGTIYGINVIKDINAEFNYIILLFMICLLGYLWFNATPSKLMMGDAGSRAMGLFISIAILKTNSPFLYIPVAIVLILDGGLGLVKVALLRFFKIRILTNIRTPLHDQVRKVMGWSNTQAVFRFAIIQGIIGLVVLYWVGMNYPF